MLRRRLQSLDNERGQGVSPHRDLPVSGIHTASYTAGNRTLSRRLKQPYLESDHSLSWSAEVQSARSFVFRFPLRLLAVIVNDKENVVPSLSRGSHELELLGQHHSNVLNTNKWCLFLCFDQRWTVGLLYLRMLMFLLAGTWGLSTSSAALWRWYWLRQRHMWVYLYIWSQWLNSVNFFVIWTQKSTVLI